MASVILGAGGDPAASRLVYSIVAALVALGVGLIVLAVWLVRRSRPDLELLEPLELMASRSWRKLDPAGRRRLLDDHRPDGAEPLDRATIEPAVDVSFEHIAEPRAFDDLAAEPVVSSEECTGDGGTGEEGTAEEGTAEGEPSEPTDESGAPSGSDPVRADERSAGSGDDEPADSDGDATAELSSPGDAAHARPTVEVGPASVPHLESENEIGADGLELDAAADDEADGDDDGEDDTGEIEADDALMVPILPGEGLLRRPKTSDE